MHIPERFLPQVLGDLSRADIVEARLGRSGGYRLTKPPGAITLLDIIEATEGDTRRQSCVLTGKTCGEDNEPCDVHEMFCDAQDALLERLGSTTVAQVLASSHGSPAGDGGVTAEAAAATPAGEGSSAWPVAAAPPSDPGAP